jgi:hypothetical protein
LLILFSFILESSDWGTLSPKPPGIFRFLINPAGAGKSEFDPALACGIRVPIGAQIASLQSLILRGNDFIATLL